MVGSGSRRRRSECVDISSTYAVPFVAIFVFLVVAALEGTPYYLYNRGVVLMPRSIRAQSKPDARDMARIEARRGDCNCDGGAPRPRNEIWQDRGRH